MKNQKTYSILCTYLGCVLSARAELGEDAPRFVLANNKHTKKVLLNNGAASKEEVEAYVREKFDLGKDFELTQDEADAGLYALLGR